MQLESYKDLIVWQKSIELVKVIYKITKAFPKSEIYSLANQMQRAAISIPSNIAEGWSRNHKLEFARFLSISYASAAELETQIIIAKDQYTNPDYLQADSLLLEIQKMLFALIKNTKSSESKW
jgi:four helix bundle protein